jgi:hypothetical protein
MSNSELPQEIESLKQQIDLNEKDYKQAVKQRKDYTTLRKIRNRIRELKNALLITKEKYRRAP